MPKEGKETTEFKKSKSATIFAYVGIVLGGLIAFGPKLLGIVEEGSTTGVIGGCIIAVSATIQKCLTDLGYIKSRTDVKVTENLNNDSTNTSGVD